MAMITSTQNSRIKATIRLRNHRERVEQQRFVIDGLRELTQAVQGDVNILEAFVCEDHCHGDCWDLCNRLAATGVTMFEVTETVWDKLSFGNRRDGILAVAEPPDCSLAILPKTETGLMVVLEGVEKPGNIGAVIRTADGAGAQAVVIADGISDVFNPNTIRASLGTIFRMPVVTSSSPAVIDWLREQGFNIIVAAVNADTVYTHCDLSGPTAIILGSEADGVSDAWKADNMTAVRLPMLGHADSLNVSATAAILLYESQRQRS